MADEYLSKLWPIPSTNPPSTLSPRVFPGATPESTATLRKVLQDNHKRWHVFIDDFGRHNHTTHHILAIWALGANSEVIEAAYKSNCEYQLAAFKSEGPITEANFLKHLGDHRHYNAYMFYFSKLLQTSTASEVLEKFLFSKQFNFDASRKTQPEMLSRLMDAIVHPLIHIGYGLELNVPGMIIEGLASTAVHNASSSVVITPDLFDAFPAVTTPHELPLQKLVLDEQPPPLENVHALTVMARMLRDNRFNDFKPDNLFTTYSQASDNFGPIIKEYGEQWTLDTSDPNMVEKKFEEIVWMNTLIYGLSFWEGEDKIEADFLYMHLVTSSLFLPSVLRYLSPRSQAILLRSYFVVCLVWWVGHGRQTLNIKDYFATNTTFPIPPGPKPVPVGFTFPSVDSPSALTPNPWLPLVQSSIVHVDEHLPKLMRALSHYAVLYGNRTAGNPELVETGLPGAEYLDGSLFIRVAGMSAKYMGRTRDGEQPLKYKEGEPYIVATFWSGVERRDE
ncbi:hypothetical protein ONZ45_g17473 [Pleurotus djamor]|nr:hypothetical protein ONZ45_g17473 [Pleurotus djamor]